MYDWAYRQEDERRQKVMEIGRTLRKLYGEYIGYELLVRQAYCDGVITQEEKFLLFDFFPPEYCNPKF